MPREVARLRHAADDRPLDVAGERIAVGCRRAPEERGDVAECGGAGAEHVGIRDRIRELIELRWIKAVLQAQPDGQRGHRRRRCERAAAAELPVAVRDRSALRDHSVDGLLEMDLQRRAGVVRRVRREVGNRVAHHVERLRPGPAAVDDAAEDLSGRAGDPGRLHPLVAARRDRRRGRGVGGHHRGAGVVALPAAGEADVALHAQVARDRDPAAAIGHVVPHQAARLRQVHRLDDEEARDVLDLPVRVSLGMREVCDLVVVPVARIELAERAPGDGLVRRLAGGLSGERLGAVDDDARDARVRWRRPGERHGGGHAD